MINSTNTAITVRTKTKGADDNYGNPVITTADETFDALVGWGATGLEFGIDRTIMTTQATVYLPTGRHIEPGADLYINGELYRQDGEAIKWVVPLGFSLDAGIVLNIKKVAG